MGFSSTPSLKGERKVRGLLLYTPSRQTGHKVHGLESRPSALGERKVPCPQGSVGNVRYVAYIHICRPPATREGTKHMVTWHTVSWQSNADVKLLSIQYSFKHTVRGRAVFQVQAIARYRPCSMCSARLASANTGYAHLCSVPHFRPLVKSRGEGHVPYVRLLARDQKRSPWTLCSPA